MSDEGLTDPVELIVGIGASAGGLEAFKAFFARLPPDSGLSFILVQHLSPDHESVLSEILARTAPIPVVQAQHGMPVEPDRIFVIPPDATLTIENKTLIVVKPAPQRSLRRPIDSFFSSLAKDQRDNAVAIVLSGVGSDGSLGLTAVKEGGGLTMAQAEFDHHAMLGMPQSATATGFVDHILKVEDMPAKLIEYRDHLALVAHQKDGEGIRTDAEMQQTTVLSVLRAKTGHDFSKYKSKTVTRRIQRRMQILQATSISDYLDHLRIDPVEPELLFRNLLIGVTEFFRDSEAFKGLATALKTILDRRGTAQPLRVWVPACSTGEEVYSIAITIRELMEADGAPLEVQIFGTDIDDRAIELARAGRYQRITGVSDAQLERWFLEEAGTFRPTPQIREMCVFSVQNVTKDPPFSKLDLISCRNLMIYMESDLQNRVLRTFHYALKPNGLLFLGLSEGINTNANLFKLQEDAASIFQRREGNAAFPLPIAAQAPFSNRPAAEHGRGAGDQVDRAVRTALAKHSPVFLVVDHLSKIQRYSGGGLAGYLEPSAGVANLGLLSNLKKSLRVVVRTALQTAVKTGEGQTVEKISVLIEGQQRLLNVIVEPVRDTGGDKLYVVAFQDIHAVAPELSIAADGTSQSVEMLVVADQLRSTQAQLHATIGDLETANEDMLSAAEEYQSVNEELQSTNEELQTSKEEAQSINEELQTVNAELIGKNELLSSLNSDLQNLLDSTQIATIFLDEYLRIRNFTPGMADLFSLRDSDRGRPLTEIVSLVAYEHLRRDVGTVLRDFTVVERELELLHRDAFFVMRIRPYRSIEKTVNGVVITFVDVSERRKAERAQRSSERRFGAIVGQAAVGITESNHEGQFLLTNTAFQQIADRSAEALKGLRRWELIYPQDLEAVNQRFAQAARDEAPFEAEYRLLLGNGGTTWVSENVSVLADERPARFISITLEIDKRKRAEEQAALLLSELDHRVKNILAVVSSIVAQTLKANLSPEAFSAEITGRITAITRAHSLLTNDGGAGLATLRDLIDIELEPYRRRDLLINGPNLVLTPKAGLSLAMAMHELTSNAAKYGSLSTPQGQLEVSWTLTDGPDRRLRLIWTESGGPHVAGPPTRRGFGTILIERAIGFEWKAQVTRSFAASGVVCTLDLPFTSAVGELRPERGADLNG